ncbi:hypothetical protein D3C87_299850 [compost metagenome]
MKRSILILISFLMLTSKVMAWEAGDVVYNNLHEGRTQIIKVVDRKRDLYLVRVLEGDRAGKVMEMMAGQNFEALTSDDGDHQTQLVRARGNSVSACVATLYSELGIFESDAERACQYGRDTQFLTCTVDLARSMGEAYVAAAGYFCSHKNLSRNSLKCATSLYLRGGQNGDKAVELCANGVNAQLNNCIFDQFNNKQRTSSMAREYCISQYDPAVIAAREAAAEAARQRAEAQKRAANEARQRMEEARRSAEEARRQQMEEQRRFAEEARKQQDAQRKALEEQSRKQQDEARKRQEAAKQTPVVVKPQPTAPKQETAKAAPVKENKPVQPAQPTTQPKETVKESTAPKVKQDDDSLPPLPHPAPAAPKAQPKQQGKTDSNSTSQGEEGGIIVDLPL